MATTVLSGVICSIIALGISSAAGATTYVATSANFGSIFYSASAGDRIVLSGSFGALQLRNRTFASALNIDARNATFTDSLLLKNVSGVSFTGGKFGSTTGPTRYSQAVVVNGGANINFASSSFVGNNNGMGLTFTNTDNVSVSRSTFTSLRRGLSFTGVTNGIMDRNQFIASSSDGAAIADSHFVTASRNACSGTAPSAGAHPDCIQLWSIAGNPVQSDITLSDNVAIGSTQGFTSFNPDAGGGLRISMLRNVANINYPQAIACYNCVDSLFADNVVTTMAGADHQARINIVGGSNNIERGNSVAAFDPDAVALPPGQLYFEPMDNDLVIEDDAGFLPLSAEALAMSARADISAAIPEPAAWMQLLLGMAAIGWVARRRGRNPVVAAC